ncbi:MAG: ComF family protein [Theionarchaea archaeon]|nr:ComF family protein [Theionarchaea archaeon]
MDSQMNLKRDERRENVKGAFEVKYPNRFKGRKILLIDDVATTCATIDECARVLKNAGAQEVNALVLARDTKPMGDLSE